MSLFLCTDCSGHIFVLARGQWYSREPGECPLSALCAGCGKEYPMNIVDSDTNQPADGGKE